MELVPEELAESAGEEPHDSVPLWPMESILVGSSSPVHSGPAEVYCGEYTRSTLLGSDVSSSQHLSRAS